MERRALRELVGVGLGLALSLGAAEWGLPRIYSPPPLAREADDAVTELRASDPDTIILGSSHARAFEGVRRALAEETRGEHRVLIVPLELGRLSAYRWLLEHRIAPLVDERRADGALARPSLRRFILVTHWWDSCFADDEPAPNVPARAWTFGDFARDVAAHGLTAFNRGYSSHQWQLATARSSVLRVRGESSLIADDLVDSIGGLVRPHPRDPAIDRARLERQSESWRAMIERGATDPRCHARGEIEAREAIMEFARQRGLEFTTVLFPLMPITVTRRARETTLRDFSQRMASLARERGHRLVDWTTSTPLLDEDFQRDFDHPAPSGVAKLARFALAGDLAFLRTPAPSRGTR